MPKLTTRDYKKTQSRALKVRGVREFSYGAVTGVVLAGVAFAYLNGRVHKSTEPADSPRPEPQPRGAGRQRRQRPRLGQGLREV